MLNAKLVDMPKCHYLPKSLRMDSYRETAGLGKHIDSQSRSVMSVSRKWKNSTKSSILILIKACKYCVDFYTCDIRLVQSSIRYVKNKPKSHED